MKTIGIIGAMSEEITYLKEKIEIVTTKNIIGLDFHVGKYCGNSIVLVISGIGKVNAAVCTQVLIDHFGVDYIINTGCAGAIHPELGIGDILISTDAVQHDMDVSALGDPIGTIPRLAESYFKADEMLVKLAQGNLLFVNSFEYEHTDDILYYILYVWKQVGMDQQKDQLRLFGDVPLRNDITNTLRNYLQYIDPLEIPSEAYLMGSEVLQAPLDLIALSLCEL